MIILVRPVGCELEEMVVAINNKQREENKMINGDNISTIYVSQKTGYDGNTGLNPENKNLDGPVRSIDRALKLISDLRMAGHRQHITVSMLDEEYYVEKPISIDSAFDNITIDGNGKNCISGGKKITGFKYDTFNGVKCFSADVPEVRDGAYYSEFYVDGKRADYTRYPSSGFLTPVEVEDNNTKLFTPSRWFIAKPEDFKVISKFKNLTDCIISYNHYWVDEHSPIESIDEGSNKIVCKYPSLYSISSDYESSALRYVVENVAEAFANKNEWYLDRDEGKLYYIPRNSEQTPENISAYLPVSERIFDIKGSIEAPAKNIYIKDLEIAYTRGDCKWRPRKDTYGDDTVYACCGQSVNRGRATVEMTFAENCSLENCHIHGIGVHGVRLYDGCKNIRICSNKIEDVGAGGIVSGGASLGEDERRYNGNNLIFNNDIKSIGRKYICGCGILICHSFNNVISHNEISDLYYTGISIGWVWGYSESVSSNNIIEYNHIYNVGQGCLDDMGGIYLLGIQDGTIVRNNLIHDVLANNYGGWGIYPDEGSSHLIIENNICYNMSFNCFHQHYGAMNVVKNNIFVMAKETPVKFSHNEMHTMAIFERNIIVADGTTIYNFAEWIDGGQKGDLGHTHVLGARGNILFDRKRDKTIVVKIGDKEFDLEEAQKRLGLECNSIADDPQFVDLENFDLRLKETSPAYKLLFKPIDMTEFGLIKK